MVGVLLALALILAIAKLAGALAIRIGQPAVLGELAAGIVLGNLELVGFHGLEHLATDHSIELLADLGVVLLLFEVGLTSTVQEMTKVGWTALNVALLGVVVPFGLGFGVSALMLRGS